MSKKAGYFVLVSIFVQLSVYALICVTAFGKQYRESATVRNDYGLDEKDAGNIIVVGLIGMVLLLPLPV